MYGCSFGFFIGLKNDGIHIVRSGRAQPVGQPARRTEAGLREESDGWLFGSRHDCIELMEVQVAGFQAWRML